MTVPGEMSPAVEQKRRAWEAYFNASRGVATNGVTGIFGKTCRIFVWEASRADVGASAFEDVLQGFFDFGQIRRGCGVGDLKVILAAQCIGVTRRQLDP